MEKKIITADNLLELIDRHDGATHFFELVETRVSGKLTFGPSIRVRHKVTFVGCDFENIEFSNAEINHELTFHKCNMIDVNVNSSKFAKPLIINTCNTQKGLNFENSSFHSVNLESLHIEAGEIKVVKVESGFFNCNTIVGSNGIEILKSNFSDEVRFLNVQNNGHYYFTDSNFKGGLRIWAGKVNSVMIFNNGTFEKYFIIEGVKFGKSLSFNGVTIKSEAKISFSSTASKRDDSIETIESDPPEEINLWNSKFEGGFRYEGIAKPEHRRVKKVSVHCSQNLTGEMSFTSMKTDTFLLKGANYSGRIILHDVAVKELQLKDFANYSKLQLHNITPLDQESTISFDRSVLGSTSLFDIDFKKFKNLVITDSQVLEIVPTNVVWTDNVFTSNEADEKGNPILNSTKARENYRQLKLVMQKQGDSVQFLEFERREWQEFRNSIMQTHWKWWHLSWWKRCNDRFILWTNGSNNFGLNWVKPLSLYLISTFVFYVLILFCLDEEVTFCCTSEFMDFLAFLKRYGLPFIYISTS
ncbi:MAG: hypothetical protein IPM82_21955 [Saprospiraceae bacterium]|nr:hypothetical protein [Saprospiraceae bacterium]